MMRRLLAAFGVFQVFIWAPLFAAVIVVQPATSGGGGMSQNLDIGTISVVSATPETPSASATATLEYRESGTSTWLTGPTPSIISSTSYGTVWGLKDGTDYEWRLTYTDAGQPLDGEIVTGTASVIEIDVDTSAQAATTTVTTESQLTTALSSASAGDIIQVNAKIELTSTASTGAAGTTAQPIYLRGNRDGAIVRGSNFPTNDSLLDILHSNWVVEGLILRGNESTSSGNTEYTVRVGGGSGAVIDGFTLRDSAIIGKRGLLARETNGQMTGFAVYDNTFTGVWSRYYLANLLSTTADATSLNVSWSDVAFRMTGQDHLIFNNTLSGYGDGAKTDEITAITNENITYARNDILWGGDDGIELDDGEYNSIAYQNRISNTGTGISRQPNGSPTGPMYAVGNVLVNQFLRPFKLNDGPPRIKLLHNTNVYTDRFTGDTGWLQFGSGAGNALAELDHLNNLYVRADTATGAFEQLDVKPSHSDEQYDGNAYFPDGTFRVEDSTIGASFAAAQGSTSISGYGGANFEDSGQLLGSQPFTDGFSEFGSDWETTVNNFNPAYSGVSAGVTLPGFSSSTPGHGSASIEYGRRKQDTALSQACDDLSVGYSILFDDIPAGTFSATGTSGFGFVQWGSSAVHDEIRREVRYVGRAASSQSPDQYDWFTYFEDTETWENNPRTIFTTSEPGHGYDHNAIDPGTGDHYFQAFNDDQVFKWDGSWSQIATHNNGRQATTITFVPGLGLVHWGDNTLRYFYDGTWTSLTTSASFQLHQISEYNRHSHTMVYGSGGSGNDQTITAMYILDADTLASTQIDTPPANFGAGSGQGVLVSDPRSDKFIGTRKSNGSWWEYDVSANSWSTLTESTGNGSTEQLGLPNLTLDSSKIATPVYECTLWIQTDLSDESGEAWLYKH